MKIKYLSTILLLSLAGVSTSTIAEQQRTRLYGPLESIVDCDTKSPLSFKFNVEANFSASLDDSDDFELAQDSRLPKACVAKKINRFEDIFPRYKTQTIAPPYIAGNTQQRRSFYFMNNVFPANSDNKVIYETLFGNLQCLSQYYTFTVQGGFIYKPEFEDHNRYEQTLGMATPYQVWYLVNRDDGDQMAFLIDNHTKTTVSKSIVSIDHLSKATGRKFKITSDDPDMLFVKYKSVWPCGKA